MRQKEAAAQRGDRQDVHSSFSEDLRAHDAPASSSASDGGGAFSPSARVTAFQGLAGASGCDDAQAANVRTVTIERQKRSMNPSPVQTLAPCLACAMGPFNLIIASVYRKA